MMKKLLTGSKNVLIIAVVTVMLIMGLTGCGNSINSSPENVVKNFLTAIHKGDVANIKKSFNPDEFAKLKLSDDTIMKFSTEFDDESKQNGDDNWADNIRLSTESNGIRAKLGRHDNTGEVFPIEKVNGKYYISTSYLK